MPLVRITAGHAVQYSLNRGLSRTEYADGEIYSVPDYVAKGMMKHRWATLFSAPATEDAPAAEEAPAAEVTRDAGGRFTRGSKP